MSNNDARQPTDPEELERQIMNSNVPKNEREWWAQGKITALQERVVEVEQRYEDLEVLHHGVSEARDKSEAALAEAMEVVRRLVSWCDEWRPGTPHPADDIAVARALIANRMPTDDWIRQRAWNAGKLIVQGIHEISIESADAKGGRYKSAFRSDIALAEHHIAVALQEARSEERALAAEEVKKQLKLADNTIRVMANDLRIADNAVKAAEAKLARLRNPDEALVDAMRRAEPRIDNVVCRKLSRAIAATLDAPERCQAELLESCDDGRERWSCPKCGVNISGPCAATLDEKEG